MRWELGAGIWKLGSWELGAGIWGVGACSWELSGKLGAVRWELVAGRGVWEL